MPVPHQPPNNIPLASSLPKVSFRKIPLQEIQQLAVPAGVQDQTHVSYGFNDGTEFEKPEHYLRHVEPIETELNRQVEYDMDEQDQEWLDALNMDRRRDQLDVVSYEVFEIIIDRLEKEWFDLMKRVPTTQFSLGIGTDGEPLADGNEDIACAICDDGECENSNAIVFCDGCNLAVHQDCYGIPYIPEGQWLCRKCTVSPDRAVSCVLCPHEGGAFKQTTQGKWAHLLCAVWIPETGVSNPVYMEPIDSVERIPKARWKLQCYLCNRRVGACIQCDNRSCFTAFHVTCARRAGMLLRTQRQRVSHSPEDDGQDNGGIQLRAWCHKHLPKSVRAQRAREEEFQDAHSQPPSPSPESPTRRKRAASLASPGKKKSARAYKRSFRAGPTLVPAYIIDHVLEYIARITLRKKPQLTQQIAKFWSLKREARRGAPLLKRLHLEPWTAVASNEQSDSERIQKLQFLLQLRKDLEKVRMLAELTRKREKEKQRQLLLIRATLVNGILFPFHSALKGALERIMALDRSSVFLNPVSPQKVPDYYDIIKRPMDWSTISAKLEEYRYTSVREFKLDVHLVLENAMIYNKVDTLYHRTAARILKVAEPIFAELERSVQVHGAAQRQLELEPEQSSVDLLTEYDGTEIDAEDNPARDAIENLIQHYYRVEIPVKSKQIDPTAASAARQKAAEKKAAERAARSERSRLAYEKRRENERLQREKGDADKAPAAGIGASTESPRMSRRVSQRSGAPRDRSTTDIASSSLSEASSRRTSQTSDSTTLEVKQLDHWDTFKRFNSGWMLPEGTKRSRSRPDIMGKPGDETSENNADAENPRKRALSGTSSASMESKKRRSESEGTLEQPVRRGSVHKGQKANDAPKTGQSSKAKSVPRAKSKDLFQPSTLCWAKVGGYPFFPAEVLDPSDEDRVPPSVLARRPSPSKASDGTEDKVYLVRFFDSTNTFGWTPRSRMHLLFEDDELDERLRRAPRRPRDIRDIRLAMEAARAQAE